MGFLDALFGRSKQAQPNLDALFALPTAALTLEASAQMHPTGVGAVCFRQVEGGPFARLKDEITTLLGGSQPDEVTDDYGYTWLVLQRDPARMSELCTDLHAVNSTLESNGFGPSLLCTTIGLRSDEGQGLALVYLYKRGTFYPFAPVDSASQRRDNALELQVRALVGGDLAIESDVSRWFPVWGAPGL
ncbi:hypothetical protein CLV30_11730 [Haloactinopolyspora alba]|uniref:Uncharacterized protein n=1 Tax=Haloactinopolyspora alba TaxID=648780 RepID=A0A2P8DR87_9ACTN|nr:hypothetical protein [Haloactinopolyspora alba]PSK99727.1 hypothetical protein CLV30_11730 [Haloactinopolyspora alba]